jgi:hypothetical protein
MVIKIEIRNDGVYSVGYPYNSSVDEYFKNLTPEFINTYGLSDESVFLINEHKNKTQILDKGLHDFLFKLSKFIITFETHGKKIIESYDVLKKQNGDLKQQHTNIKNKISKSLEELTFVSSNVKNLKNDVVKINELIKFYKDQIVEDDIVYNKEYTTVTATELSIINDLIPQINSDLIYYKDSLTKQSVVLATIKKDVNLPSNYSIILRYMYEEWQKRHEEYYKKLVEYFKPQYDSLWTYGSSLMYSEKLEEESASFAIYKNISSKFTESVFKMHDYDIEKQLKEYSLNWLNGRTDINVDEFKFHIENKKLDILNKKLIEIEDILSQKTKEIRKLFSIEKEQNYNKYKELVLEKIRYIMFNFNTGVDDVQLDNYDKLIASFQPDYTFVVSKLSQSIYWELLAEKDIYSDLLTELNTRLSKSKANVSGGFVKVKKDNSHLIEKINFYNNEKKVLDEKILELVMMQSNLDTENNVCKDEMSLISSKMYANDSLIATHINNYIDFFYPRISFFINDNELTDNEKIITILSDNFITPLKNDYNLFESYHSIVKWYNHDDREKLKKLYKKILEIIQEKLSSQWDKEFSHEILNVKKYDIYDYYFNKETKNLYAIINKHILEKKYSSGYVDLISSKKDKLKSIFEVYSKISFDIKKNIRVCTNIFNYTDIFEFDVVHGDANIENVRETFFSILDNIVTFAYNKNIEYKDFEELIENKKKIDRVWLDMEKKYV